MVFFRWVLLYHNQLLFILRIIDNNNLPWEALIFSCCISPVSLWSELVTIFEFLTVTSNLSSSSSSSHCFSFSSSNKSAASISRSFNSNDDLRRLTSSWRSNNYFSDQDNLIYNCIGADEKYIQLMLNTCNSASESQLSLALFSSELESELSLSA